MSLCDWPIGWNIVEQLVSVQRCESGPLTHAAFPSLPLTKSDLSVHESKERHVKSFLKHMHHVFGMFITTTHKISHVKEASIQNLHGQRKGWFGRCLI
jgi:hypothetical protein